MQKIEVERRCMMCNSVIDEPHYLLIQNTEMGHVVGDFCLECADDILFYVKHKKAIREMVVENDG